MITKLEQNANHLTIRFPENHMKLNEDKCHLIIFGIREEKVSMHAGDVQIEETDDEKLVGITLDKKLTFKNTSKQSVKKLVKASCTYAYFHLHGTQEAKIADESIRNGPV